MTREEAINKVRQMSLPKETMDILEALAPELTMSEDEMMIYELQGFLSSFGSDYFGIGEWQKFDDWLEKQKEQKPAEWSEEDERILKGIIGLIDHDQHYGVSNNEMISWLKSLRPKSHWKPSEEQMAMLLAVINEPNNAMAESCQLALKSLYEHLKKLM